MQVSWPDGVVARFDPESDYDREMLKKAEEQEWTQERILDSVIAARQAGLSR